MNILADRGQTIFLVRNRLSPSHPVLVTLAIAYATGKFSIQGKFFAVPARRFTVTAIS
jgi:hypothetical protein